MRPDRGQYPLELVGIIHVIHMEDRQILHIHVLKPTVEEFPLHAEWQRNAHSLGERQSNRRRHLVPQLRHDDRRRKRQGYVRLQEGFADRMGPCHSTNRRDQGYDCRQPCHLHFAGDRWQDARTGWVNLSRKDVDISTYERTVENLPVGSFTAMRQDDTTSVPGFQGWPIP